MGYEMVERNQQRGSKFHKYEIIPSLNSTKVNTIKNNNEYAIINCNCLKYSQYCPCRRRRRRRRRKRKSDPVYLKSQQQQRQKIIINLPFTLGLFFLSLILHSTWASEFPERECCDPVYPIPAPGPGFSQSSIGHGAIAPAAAYPEFVPPTHSTAITTDIPPGGQMKTATAIMNCIQARNFCVDNSACSPILEIVPRVCGTEKVACTTMTVTKCVAALRTLKAFPYFYPTCLCREPSSDPTCNAFRDYLFDHPCTMVEEKEKDPFPVDALPTCDYALDVCRKDQKCIQHYRDFKSNCRVSDGICRMDDWDLCHDSWTKLRLTPMFGCICPSGHPKCDRIYGEVNYNPCVEQPHFDYTGSTSALYALERRREMGLSHLFSFTPASIFPNPGTAHQRHHHHHHNMHQQQRQHPTFNLDSNVVIVPAARTESHLFVDESFSTPISYRGYPSPGSYSTSQSGSITVQVISSSHAPDHEIESQLETPLLGSAEAHAEQRSKPPLFTFIPPVLAPPKHKLTTDRGGDDGSRSHSSSPRFSGGIATISSVTRHYGGSGGGAGGASSNNQVLRVPLHSTCYTALQNCHRSPACSKLLQNVIYWCDLTRCRQETCMQALQNFYRGVQERWALEVAFCLCRKSEHRHDQECLHAQGQLHPVCAQRGDLGISPPSCHSLAVQCRAQPDCRTRLEIYEKACAVDSVTRKCAGPTAQCRNATIGILGTVLKKTCACNGTDYTQLYDCLGWQRILWVNPCVVESQRDYHRIKSLAGGTSRPRSTTTIGNPTETEIYSHEGVLMGTDVLSTTLGHAVQPSVYDSRPEYIPQDRITTTFHSRTTTTNSDSLSHNNTHNSRHRNHNNRHHNSNNNEHQHSQHHNSQWVGHTNSPPGNFYSSSTSTSTKMSINHNPTTEEVTTLRTPSTTTQRTTSTSTQPHNYCPVRRPNQPDQLIMEGQARRLYREDRRSCSELCTCPFDNLQASCTVLTCLEVTTCDWKQRDNKTVFYKHEEPMYLAGRGQCMCYGGHFICMRPLREKYNLFPGVFLFLGYSNQDEAVLKDHTGLDATNVIDDLRKLVDPLLQYQFVNPAEKDHGLNVFKNLNTSECRLNLFGRDDENLIISATIPREDFGANFTIREPKPDDQLLIREKEKCSPILKELAELINSKASVIQSHPLLSILKLAEAHENNIPKSSSGHKLISSSTIPMLLLYSLMTVLLQQLFIMVSYTSTSYLSYFSCTNHHNNNNNNNNLNKPLHHKTQRRSNSRTTFNHQDISKPTSLSIMPVINL